MKPIKGHFNTFIKTKYNKILYCGNHFGHIKLLYFNFDNYFISCFNSNFFNIWFCVRSNTIRIQHIHENILIEQFESLII